MSEVIKLCEIKLFGKTIYFLPNVKVTSGTTVLEQQQSSTETSLCSQESKDDVLFVETETSSGTSDNFNTTSLEKGVLSPKTPKKKETNETLKKPDKILPCPRCKSMETKFCYFNNYNVNQPRYFCKKCQRYWTAGGVTRSVPVGSGRRKNKNAFTPNYQNVANGTNLSSLTQNGFILFGMTDGSQNCVPNVSSPYRGQQVQHTPFALGKRSSNGEMIRPSSSEKENLSEKASQERSVLIPKSLTIHDPNEATKSSIWSSLGIKNKRIGSNNGSSPFKAYVSLGVGSRNGDNAAFVSN